jgi:hypothetical protein
MSINLKIGDKVKVVKDVRRFYPAWEGITAVITEKVDWLDKVFRIEYKNLSSLFPANCLSLVESTNSGHPLTKIFK